MHESNLTCKDREMLLKQLHETCDERSCQILKLCSFFWLVILKIVRGSRNLLTHVTIAISMEMIIDPEWSQDVRTGMQHGIVVLVNSLKEWVWNIFYLMSSDSREIASLLKVEELNSNVVTYLDDKNELETLNILLLALLTNRIWPFRACTGCVPAPNGRARTAIYGKC